MSPLHPGTRRFGRNGSKLALLLAMAGAVGLFFMLDLGDWFTLARLQSAQSALADQYAARPLSVIAVYALTFIALFALALPAGTVMTLAGGAIFGFWIGVCVVSFASTIGATLAFLSARYLLADAARRRFGARLEDIDKGVERDGGFYLFTLRLIPLFPPALLSVLFGLTTMRTWTFYWVSQLGMLSGTLIYVNAGTQLARLQSVHDILSPAVLGSLVLLGAFPLLARKIVAMHRAGRTDNAR